MFRNRRPNSRPAPGRRPRPSRASKGSSLDPALFIRKAVEPTPEEVFVPSFEFKDLPVDTQLRGNILNKGYKFPTPIQDASILPISEGRDVLGIANTGTGKTAAFLIPLLHRAIQPGPKERVLVLVPTREIATQIFQEFLAFSRGLRLRAVVCVGGLPIYRQIRDLKTDPNFVIATPGRIKDLIERRAVDLSKFTRVILDEADRMVDMGFINDVRHILAQVPEKRQSLFFSATLPKEVKDLIHSFLHDPVTISVKKQETAMNVEQDVIWVSRTDNKIGMLVDLLRKEHFDKVLIFARTKRGVDKLTHFLEDVGFAVACIHGDKQQSQRQRALDAFKAHRIKILVATDVAARGLDIPNVSHVINYEAPEAYEDYVHRIGRTGRAGKKGHALTFVDRRF
ncbi:MAG: DEAD/DEAH box helicase [Candidatus Gracilibacteria bacterium]